MKNKNNFFFSKVSRRKEVINFHIGMRILFLIRFFLNNCYNEIASFLGILSFILLSVRAHSSLSLYDIIKFTICFAFFGKQNASNRKFNARNFEIL